MSYNAMYYSITFPLANCEQSEGAPVTAIPRNTFSLKGQSQQGKSIMKLSQLLPRVKQSFTGTSKHFDR